jgi:PIN domain nuclease of toxin-antitoxin system
MEHLATLLKLPLHHRDPFDRLIIAQALSEGVAVLSDDPEFRKYPVQVIG